MSDQAKNCPNCNVPWEADDTIYEHFLKQGKQPREARRIAEMYGCTKKNPKHFGINVIGVEVPGKYDGVSYWKCQSCWTMFDRWTMEPVVITEKELNGDLPEPYLAERA